VNGVRFLLQRLRSRGRDLRDLGGVKLAAIGPGTAGALREYHLEPDVVPAEEFRAERLAEELRERVRGQKVLLARADRGREVLRERLAEVAAVEQVTVYAQVDAIDPSSEVFDALRRGEIDFVTLTSSNIARSFLGALDETIQGRLKRGGTKLVSISPVTSEAVRALGYAVAAEAEEYTSEGVIRALVGLAGEGEL
ncbi:MAG TPA: uroporphyrinogen-III synthase, partial [Gemmataceae bacterium]